MDRGKTRIVILNEINTLRGFTPSGMHPLLWDASGVSYLEPMQHLVKIALQRHQSENRELMLSATHATTSHDVRDSRAIGWWCHKNEFRRGYAGPREPFPRLGRFGYGPLTLASPALFRALRHQQWLRWSIHNRDLNFDAA